MRKEARFKKNKEKHNHMHKEKSLISLDAILYVSVQKITAMRKCTAAILS